MKEFWNKYKILIITIVIILIIVAIIYYAGKHAGGKYVPNNIEIPSDTQAPGTPGIYNPGPVTDAIFNDLDKIVGFHDTAPYDAAMKLSNSQLAAVYNDWNKRYSDKFDHKTIIQAIESDWSPWNINWEFTTRDLVARFKSLPGAQGRTLIQ